MASVEECLDAMDALLRRAVARALARPALEAALRREILEITQLRLATGYSPRLEEADVALTAAITAFRRDQSDESLDLIRSRMGEYRVAALSSEFRHSPIESLAGLGLGRGDWDAAIRAARA